MLRPHALRALGLRVQAADLLGPGAYRLLILDSRCGAAAWAASVSTQTERSQS